MSLSRRSFIQKTALAGAALALSSKGYGSVLGSNERVNMAVIGLNGRGQALISSVAQSSNTRISHLCDVDSRAVINSLTMAQGLTGYAAKGVEDFRRILDDKEVDAIAIAAPDHWQTPMTLLALEAGKHVYVEKPGSHNPHEAELLIRAQAKYDRAIQMGNQQRSAPSSMQAIVDIREGLIGDVYYAKAWYANNRGSIGNGNKVPPPEWLNWELWQGPAPRQDYQDNLVHYNWHWFWNWGTGEINNNGTHEIDIARWALGVERPNKVTSSGGRFHFDDDWQFYDTQDASFEFPGGKMITWEGRSCNGFEVHGRGRGTTIHGTKGTALIDRNLYQAFDLDGKLIKEVTEAASSATTNTVGAGALDNYHMQNFVNAIRQGEKLNSPIAEGQKSVVLCHLGNIAQRHGGALEIDPESGQILNNRKARQMWKRDYAKGWEPKV